MNISSLEMNSIDLSGPVAAWFRSAEGKDVLKDVCEQTRVDGIDVNPTAGGCKLNIKADDADLTSLANMLLNIHIENQEKLLKHMSPEEVEEAEGRRVSFQGKSLLDIRQVGLALPVVSLAWC